MLKKYLIENGMREKHELLIVNLCFSSLFLKSVLHKVKNMTRDFLGLAPGYLCHKPMLYIKDPVVLAALQGKLGSIVGQNSGYIASLPAPVKRR